MTPVPVPTRTPVLDEVGTPARPWVMFFQWLVRKFAEVDAAIAAIGTGGGGATGLAWAPDVTGATGTVTLDHASYTHFLVEMAGDITLDAPLNLRNQPLVVFLRQDGTGGHVVTFDAFWPAMRDIIPIANTTRVINTMGKGTTVELISLDDQG